MHICVCISIWFIFRHRSLSRMPHIHISIMMHSFVTGDIMEALINNHSCGGTADFQRSEERKQTSTESQKHEACVVGTEPIC